MYITEEELNKRIESLGSVKIVERKHNRAKGEIRLDEESRVALGILCELDTNKNAGELFGVSEMTASYASRGLRADGVVDKDLAEKVNKGRINKLDEIQDKAIDNLTKALTNVGSGIESLRPDKASRIAVEMAGIVDKFTPKSETPNGMHFHIHVPAQADESEYEVVTVK